MFAILYLRSHQKQKLGQATQTNLQLAQQQLRLERAQKDEQGRFILMLTHELKTPMAVVRMALDALRVQGPLKTRADQALHDMNQIVERCQQVEQLEQHGFSLSTEPCQLDEMLLTLQDSSEAPERIRLHIEPMPPFLTDPPLLRIVMDNLLNNAVKYAAPATPITVRAAPALQKGRAGVRVSVYNQPGVAGVPDAARVFDKYYRSAGAHQKTGSGLGLYLVRSIATLLGGEVHMSLLPMTCDDAEGQAADSLCFTVWIPY
jgi:signal transduction histidine kinase